MAFARYRELTCDLYNTWWISKQRSSNGTFYCLHQSINCWSINQLNNWWICFKYSLVLCSPEQFLCTTNRLHYSVASWFNCIYFFTSILFLFIHCSILMIPLSLCQYAINIAVITNIALLPKCYCIQILFFLHFSSLPMEYNDSWFNLMI